VTENDPALNVQNGFFNQARKNHTRVAIVLTSGQRITGMVKSFDKYTLLLDTRGGEQVVFKHAIATVSATGPVDKRPGEPAAEERPAKFGNFLDLEGVRKP